MRCYRINLRVGPAMEPGHAQVSTAMQDLERQVDALLAAGIEPKHIYPDKKPRSNIDRPGLAGLLRHASDGERSWFMVCAWVSDTD